MEPATSSVASSEASSAASSAASTAASTEASTAASTEASTAVSSAASRPAISPAPGRILRMQMAMAAQGIDAFFVRETTNIQWLTGFDRVFDTERAHALIVAPDQLVLHTDSRYSTACRREAAALGSVVEVDDSRRTHGAVCADVCAGVQPGGSDGVQPGGADGVQPGGADGVQLGGSDAGAEAGRMTLGIEDSLTLADFDKLQAGFNAAATAAAIDAAAMAELLAPAAGDPAAAGDIASTLAAAMTDAVRAPKPPIYKQTSNFVFGLRAVKDDDEIRRMRAAQAITDAAFAHIAQFTRPGMTERQVQLELDNFMLSHGADGLAFASIVAAGENGANPHAIPGDTILEAGQCMVLDFGARALGYCSDMTRVLFLGQPDELMTRAYAALRQANEEVEALIRPGVTGVAMHQHAEDVLAANGFGGKMGHGLGHGVGLDIHEEPCLNTRNDRPLEPGNVVTVEPGIYLPGQFGMRLEDFGVVTASGFDVFTQSTHDMVII